MLVPSAQATGDKFEHAMLLFAKCHNMYNSAEYISTSDADDLGKKPHQYHYFAFGMTPCTCPHLGRAIDTWLHHYRSTFPTATVLPKMHFLEDHAVPFIKKWHTGFGFLGEQGSQYTRSTSYTVPITTYPTRWISYTTWSMNTTFASALTTSRNGLSL